MLRSLLCVAFLAGVLADEKFSIPLKNYVNYPSPDGIFSWNVSSDVKHFPNGYTMYNVFMTSQKWLTPSDSSTPIYQHWLQVCVPDVLEDSTFAYLWIDGYEDAQFNNPPSSLDDTVYIPCVQSKSLSFGLYQIPNAPVYFQGDYMHKRRVEDAIVAYTWAHYLNNSKETDWIAEFPMAKAGIKALDAAQQFWETIRGDLPGIERFSVAGASKRGWTTWLVGAMGDPRVVSIVPVVAPVGNIIEQMNEQWEAYGNWSFVLEAYLTEGIMGWLNTPEFYRLTKLIDPLSFRDELAGISKYEVGATNDEFFMPDALKWFWDDMPGQKMWRIIPNCDHTIAGHAKEALESIATYVQAFKKTGGNITLPEYSWLISEDARTIVVTASTAGLVKVQVWSSLNKPNRDWRAVRCDEKSHHCINPEAEFFPHDNVTVLAPGVFSHTVDVPKSGHYSAFFIELHYELIPGAKTIVVTSNVAISPTTMPYAPCPPSECACKWDCPSSY